MRRLAPLTPLVGLLSCSADPPVDPDFESASATDANQPTGGPSADGADDESGALPVAVEEHCLFDPVGTLYGFKYQCEGSVAVDVLVEHPFEGSPETGFLELTFGPDEAGDSYADPLVMACCPWYHEHDPYCEQPHERACWIDLVEQGCKSMPSRIEAFAHEHFPGALNAAKRGAILQIADHVGDNQVACVQAFRDTTGLAAMLQECDNEGNSVDFADMLETGSWTFDPPGLVQHVEISIPAAAMSGFHPVGDTDPEICWSADENDGTVFLEIDPPPEAIVLHLASGNASLVGPEADGRVELEPASTLVLSSRAIESLDLYTAGAVAYARGLAVPVDRAHLRLWERAAATAEGSTLSVAPGAAKFVASVSMFGEQRHLQHVTNATPIIVAHDGDGWSTSAFLVGVSDGEAWSATVVVEPARWHGGQ